MAAITSKQMIYDFFWWLLNDFRHRKTGKLMVLRSFKWIRELAYYHGYVYSTTQIVDSPVFVIFELR